MIGGNLTLTSNFKIDLARLPPCFGNFLSHIYRGNHHLALYKRADETFIEASNPYDGKQGWLKNHTNLLEAIWQVGPILPSALLNIVDSVEQEHEQEVLIELNDCFEEKKDADFSTD